MRECGHDLCLRPLGVRPLRDLRSAREVVGGQATTGGELIATEADDHLAVGNERRRCDGLALGGVGVLDDPDLLAGPRVERDDEAIEGAEHQLAVRSEERRGGKECKCRVSAYE